MPVLVVNTQRQYEEKELASMACSSCGKLGMAYVSSDTVGDPHYCNKCKPKEIDE